MAISVPTEGAVKITLRITPKTPVRRLFFLLGYSLDPRGWRDGKVDVIEHNELLPALAHAFERQAERALGRSLLQGYRTTDETSLVVRGRIREADQSRRRFGAALPVEITYDDFTADVTENQLLRSAVDRLLRLPGVPHGIRSRLLRQRARLNARYHQALHLAETILKGASVDHGAGRLHIDGFLFDMSRLFEDFVCLALREALIPHGGRSTLQANGVHMDEAHVIRMRPDLIWYDDQGSPMADPKYKAEKQGGYPETDL